MPLGAPLLEELLDEASMHRAHDLRVFAGGRAEGTGAQFDCRLVDRHGIEAEVVEHGDERLDAVVADAVVAGTAGCVRHELVGPAAPCLDGPRATAVVALRQRTREYVDELLAAVFGAHRDVPDARAPAALLGTGRTSHQLRGLELVEVEPDGGDVQLERGRDREGIDRMRGLHDRVEHPPARAGRKGGMVRGIGRATYHARHPS